MYENYFIAGVCFFGIAQMFYTMSFGWEMCNYVSMMMMVSINYILQVFFLRNISFIVISELSLQKYKTRRFIRWSLVTACCSLLWDGEQLMLQLFPMLPVGILSWRLQLGVVIHLIFRMGAYLLTSRRHRVCHFRPPYCYKPVRAACSKPQAVHLEHLLLCSVLLGPVVNL